MGPDLPGPGHDPRRGRPTRSPRDGLRDERRKLPETHRRRAQTRTRPAAGARDDQNLILIVAQSRKPLASVSRRDNHSSAATTDSHPDCRATLIQIVALHPSQIIGDLGPIIRGWANYYRHGASKPAFHVADHHVRAKLWRWAKRRHPTKSATWVRSRYFDSTWSFVDGRTRLARHDDMPVTRHAKVQGKRSPLNPDDRGYWEARRCRRLDEALRSPKRLALLKRQDYRCAMCGVWFDPDEDIPLIDEHHDTPRHCGGSDRMDNLQLVHRRCHHGHHARIGCQAAEA